MNKRVLLATHNLTYFAGSELNIYDLARRFKKLDYDVYVATFNYGEPIKSIFEKAKIEVVNILESELSHKNFELIWVQHFPVINHLLFEKSCKAQKIIYSSLSPYEPLETPPLYADELSLILANSEETSKSLIEKGFNKSKIHVFLNSVQESFFKAYQKGGPRQLKKLAVVTNHLDKDLEMALPKLREEGIEVDMIGIGHEPKLVTSKLLSEYDAVISIGKTVQYALAAGLPVYCYDRFGGPGWITLKNIKQNEAYNFSGRPVVRRLNPKKIVREILDGFAKVLAEREALHRFARKNYSFDENFDIILKKVTKTNNVNIDNLLKSGSIINQHNQAYIREYTSKASLKEGHDYLIGERERHMLKIEELTVENEKLRNLEKPLTFGRRMKNKIPYGVRDKALKLVGRK